LEALAALAIRVWSWNTRWLEHERTPNLPLLTLEAQPSSLLGVCGVLAVILGNTNEHPTFLF